MSSKTVAKLWFSKEWLLEQKKLVALLALIAMVSSMSSSFFTLNNLFNIDLSVGALLAPAIDACTGVIVAKGKVQAFIATLVMMLLLRGATMVYTHSSTVNTGFTDEADAFG